LDGGRMDAADWITCGPGAHFLGCIDSLDRAPIVWERGAVGSNPATPTTLDDRACMTRTARPTCRGAHRTMKSTVETLTPTRVRLAVEVSFDELKPSLDAAYKRIGA